MVMPCGIKPFVLGGGDCRKLPWGSKAMPRCISDMTSGTSLPVGVEGLLLCFVRYDDEPADLGNEGLVFVSAEGKV